jgi:6-phosphogluconolactonase
MLKALTQLTLKQLALTLSFTLLLMNSTYSKTFVYVSSADEGDIGTYEMLPTGELIVGMRVKAAPLVMPMAVNAKLKLLYAGSRSKPYSVLTYRIDPNTGMLNLLNNSPLAESFPFISLDKTGRYLFGAGYGSSLVSVNAVDAQGKVSSTPAQIVPVGRNAHSVRVDATNQFLFVPTLGSDEVFQFKFNAKTGLLTSNTPAVSLTKAGTGPRHFVFSNDNRFVYLLSELVGTITTFALDSKTGLLTQLSIDSILPPGSDLQPGLPRGAVGVAGAPVRSVDKDIWAADIHMTPDGKFLIASERTNSTLTVFSVDSPSGKITQTSCVQTEKQPRGFAVDPSGQFVIATGELSSTLSVHKLDSPTGTLTLVGKYPTGKASSWVETIAF